MRKQTSKNPTETDAEVKAKKAKASTIPQLCKFCGIIDFPNDLSTDEKERLTAKNFVASVSIYLGVGVRIWAIVHNHDIYTADTEPYTNKSGSTIVHHKGELKRPHLHFVAITDSKKTENGFREKLQIALTLARWDLKKEFPMNLITSSFCTSPTQSIRYLVHLDENEKQDGEISDGEKTPYDPTLVATNDPETFNLALNGISSDFLSTSQLFEVVEKAQNLKQVIQLIGLKNTSRYLGVIKALLTDERMENEIAQKKAFFRK